MGKARARRPAGLTWSSQNQQGGQDPEAGRPQQGGSHGNHHGADGSARPAGRPRFYPGRRNAVGPVPRVSGGRSQGGVGLRGGNKPLRGLGGGLPAGPSTWACFGALQGQGWALTLTGGRGRGRPPKLERDVVPVPGGEGRRWTLQARKLGVGCWEGPGASGRWGLARGCQRLPNGPCDSAEDLAQPGTLDPVNPLPEGP